jgi:peroxiredoxin
VNEIRLSKKALLFIAVGVVLVSFLGVLAGTRFLSWQQERDRHQRIEGLDRGEGSKLRAGQTMPDVLLVGVDGTTTSPSELSSQGSALLLFLAIDCEPCSEVVQTWHPYASRLPQDVRVYGICQDEVEYARVYAEKSGFPFPLYCDTAMVFGNEFELNVYPTVIGVHQGGTIKFIRHGFQPEFTPDKAVALLVGGGQESE